MSLHIDYRPKTLKEVEGNRSTVEALQAILSREKDLPHAFLFLGAPGCGKTTLGRIVANELGCAHADMREVDVADFRGIDTIRDIRQQARLKPMAGPVRVWILDECFAAGTNVETPSGPVKIESVAVGDKVLSITGDAVVRNVFKNKVSLGRVIRLSLSDGRELFTTKQHRFLTETGWKEAQYLKNNFIFSTAGIIMDSINLPAEGKNEKMRVVRGGVQKKERIPKGMFSLLCSKTKEQGTWVRARIKKAVRMVQEGFCYKGDCRLSAFLQQFLPIEVSYVQTGYPGQSVHQGIGSENFRKNETILRRSPGVQEDAFRKDEKKQPWKQPCNSRKNEGHETTEWDIKCLASRAWREREIDRATNKAGLGSWLGNRSCGFFRGAARWVSYMLQNRCGFQPTENRDRGRWERPLVERRYVERCKKREGSNRVRVESVEVYKPGYNDRSFFGVVRDKEKDQGFVDFYDLEIDGHPSYFANGVAVHNCHKLTGDAQNALLKILEDTPPHVFFILCTTDPEKLLKTIRSRCMAFSVGPLSERQTTRLLQRIVQAEGVENFPEEAYKQLHAASQGHPRRAVVELDRIIDLDPKSVLKAIEQTSKDEALTIDLCRALLKREAWGKVAAVLRGIQDQEEESVRRAVLGYMNAVLLKEDNQQAAQVIECFKGNFFDCGKAGLTQAAYDAVSI